MTAIEVDKPTRHVWIERMTEGFTPEETYPELTFTLALNDSGSGPRATNGEDFDANAVIGQFTIPEGQLRMRVGTISVIDDDDAEPYESLSIIVAHVSDDRFVPAMAGEAAVTVQDNVSVKTIRVKVLSGEELENAPIAPKYEPQQSGVGFAFNVRITITGERLDEVEIRQQVNTAMRVWNYDGTEISALGHSKAGKAEILKSHDWGYNWKNTNLLWPANHDPPRPQDKPMCVLLQPGHKEVFEGVYGIENGDVLTNLNPQ